MINHITSGTWLLEFNWIDINDEKFVLPSYEDRRELEQAAMTHFNEAGTNAETIIELVRAEWRRMRPDIPQTVSLNVTIVKRPVKIRKPDRPTDNTGTAAPTGA